MRTLLEKASLLGPLLASATCALWLGWGYTVDDALISTRVAHHVASGLGYRFNPGGPIVDCVTPLGWAVLLAPFSGGGAWQGLLAARWLGVACHLLSTGILAWVWMRNEVPTGAALAVCVPLALCLPLGAWASSGMETALVTLITTASLLGGSFTLPAAALASALRPELLPWAFALGALAPAKGPTERIKHVALVLSGALGVALLRTFLFGNPAPLAVFAKPSDLAHGLRYVAGGVVFTGLPLLLLSGRAYGKLPVPLRVHALAVAAHLGAMVVAGGDWMALFRLFVPVLPITAAIGAALLASDRRWWGALKWSAGVAAAGLLAYGKGADARGVLAAREQLIVHATPLLEDRVVGALDVGWVGAARPRAVVDFAGVTDPEIARLAGGHTSKRLPNDLLYRRSIDTLVLLVKAGSDPGAPEPDDWRRLPFARVAEQRAVRLEGSEAFVPVQTVPLQGTEQYYLIVQRLGERLAEQ